MEVLISKALTDSNISHNEFILIHNVIYIYICGPNVKAMDK